MLARVVGLLAHRDWSQMATSGDSDTLYLVKMCFHPMALGNLDLPDPAGPITLIK